MSAAPSPAPPAGPAPDEESARADLYGLFACLYYAPPGASLLAALRGAKTEVPAPGDCVQEPWQRLVDAARAADAGAVAQEYERLFGGVGKPEVYLYGSHYLSGFLNEKPLARLRSDLQRLGLARTPGLAETEDHIACLCEVMRQLIADAGSDDDDALAGALTVQRGFFATHVQPWAGALCDALDAHPQAVFYAALARLTRAFVAVETQGFDMLDGD